MAVTVSLVNMKGGVGKTTLTFNLAWYAAWAANLRVLAVDLDPQSNLSQYFMGAESYLKYLSNGRPTVLDIFEQFSAPFASNGSAAPLDANNVIHRLKAWQDNSLLDLLPARLELAWTLKNPTDKSHLLPRFLSQVSHNYDLIIIDCPPTESILTTAAYQASRYVAVPVKPEFLATIGLPLLARSIEDFKMMHQNHQLDMAGIIFNGLRRSNTPPEQTQSIRDVTALANKQNWHVFDNVAHHSDSYPAGSRQSDPIFLTDYAREYVKDELNQVADQFLRTVGII
ncbi:Cobyrinic acid a,c-diamide synthase CobQ/CobB [Pseudovibrio sp. FO-BEG1]|uniref:ParA family protein n=1 Tax=Pseudovibrio sp. (strain FO-BEG1) TaxID=911045 RepID=UPI000238CEEA|nr:ParA family protein [Pseudovibrio sp. FO-BEG1]AEV39215.1 Cobyrinic acid a,c-diamide synthase CobQ/CobB [Pseudovibrio sp. FO-BEG1]